LLPWTGTIFNNTNNYGYLRGNISSGYGECDIVNSNYILATPTDPCLSFYKYYTMTQANKILDIKNNGSVQLQNSSSTVDISLATLGGLKTDTSIINPSEIAQLTGITYNINSAINTANSNITTLQNKTTNISYSSPETIFTNGTYFNPDGQTFPTTNSGSKSGLNLYWNASAGNGEICYLNHSQGSTAGGHYFYQASGSQVPTLCMSISNSVLTLPSNVFLLVELPFEIPVSGIFRVCLHLHKHN
jgi:hypothetical protein